MRAYIKRTEECLKILSKVKIDDKSKYTHKQWLMESEESFHGEISDTGDSFIFEDVRLPEFELPLQFVEIE